MKELFDAFRKPWFSSHMQTTTTPATETIKATLIEAGNGLPSSGLVYDSESNTVYEIVSTSGNIETNGSGMGNSMSSELIEAGDPSDYSDDEWSEVSDVRVVIGD